MKLNHHVLVVIGTGLLCSSTVHASGEHSHTAGMKNHSGYSSQYNPWRAQPRQHRGYWGSTAQSVNGNGNGSMQRLPRQASVTMPQPTVRRSYMPQSPIPARQHEYRSYIQQVNPYYSGANSGPWWSDPVAVPYGPWATGNGWPNGLW